MKNKIHSILNRMLVKKRLLAHIVILLAMSPGILYADIIYFPWEYNSLYSDKVALELELKNIKSQYIHERDSLKDKISSLENEILKLNDTIAFLEKQRAGDSANYEKRIADLERSLNILGKKSGQKERELVEENQQTREKYEGQLKELRDELESEKRKCMEQLASLKDSHFEEIRKKDKKIADLTEELSRLKELSDSQKQELSRLQDQADKLMESLKKEIDAGDIRVKKMHNRIVINIDDRISFDSGSDKLKGDVKSALDRIAKIINDYPENRVVIEGHTDNVPIRTARFPDNWQLSTARALSVLRYILAQDMVTPDRFSAAGYGEYQPVVPNDSPENRSLNRRVDIVLIPRSIP